MSASSHQKKTDEREIKPWGCGGGHVLGQAVKETSGASWLLLYRYAIVPGQGEVEVMATVEGRVMDVRCSICGRVRTWFMDVKTVKKMVRRVKN